MIVEGFVLHVYCKEKTECCAPFGHSHAEFSSNNKRTARTQARSYGWVFEGRDVTCRWCTERRKKEKH